MEERKQGERWERERLKEEQEEENEEEGFSAVNLSARTSLKHHGWRSSCKARHNVERYMSSELCRRSTFRRRLVHVRFDLGQNFRRSPPVGVTRLSHRDAAASASS